MKKIMGLLTVVLLLCLSVNAQDRKMQNDKRFFLSLAGGPSFPVSDFASKNLGNSEAGFAKTGVDVNMNFGYQLHEYFGIVSAFMYSNNKLDLSEFDEVGISADHWQYYGGLVGPMITFPVNEKIKVDLKALAGITNVNFPTLKVDGINFSDEEWSTAFAMQFGTDLKVDVSSNLYLVSKLDYNFMKPKFDMSIHNAESGHERISGEQKMSVVNFNVGLGIKF